MNIGKFVIALMVVSMLDTGVWGCIGTGSSAYAMKNNSADISKKDVIVNDPNDIGKDVRNSQINMVLDALAAVTKGLNQHRGALRDVEMNERYLQSILESLKKQHSNSNISEICIGEVERVLGTMESLKLYLINALPHLKEAEKKLHISYDSLNNYQQ